MVGTLILSSFFMVLLLLIGILISFNTHRFAMKKDEFYRNELNSVRTEIHELKNLIKDSLLTLVDELKTIKL